MFKKKYVVSLIRKLTKRGKKIWFNKTEQKKNITSFFFVDANQ